MPLANRFYGVFPERHCRQNARTGDARHNCEYFQSSQLPEMKPRSGEKYVIYLSLSWAFKTQLFSIDPGTGVANGAGCAKSHDEFNKFPGHRAQAPNRRFGRDRYHRSRCQEAPVADCSEAARIHETIAHVYSCASWRFSQLLSPKLAVRLPAIKVSGPLWYGLKTVSSVYQRPR